MACVLFPDPLRLSCLAPAPALERFCAIISHAKPTPISATGSGLAETCCPRLRTSSPPPLSDAKPSASSTSDPGRRRVRNCSSVSSMRPRVWSTSCSSCSVVAIARPHLRLDDDRRSLHLALCHRRVFLQLGDG